VVNQTTSSPAGAASPAPTRVTRPSPVAVVLALVIVTLFVRGVLESNITVDRALSAGPRLVQFFQRAIPPDWAIIPAMYDAMLTTIEMALVGTVAGIAISVPAALLAARNTSPHPVVAYVVRLVITTFRALPELVWALIFIVAVGLGPFAGILAIAVDVIGFAGKFFAERIEEIDRGPVHALTSTGAGRLTVIATAILPPAFPSFTGTSLYTFEKSVRSAVILGLVGVGGIGVEFDLAMTLFRYDEALAILLLILVTLIVVERISVAIRQNVI
jgi:phosphonate transport system permease protein